MNVRLTTQEKELNELVTRMWLAVNEINIILREKAENKLDWRKKNRLNFVVNTFNKRAEELRKKFHGKDKVVVLVPRYNSFSQHEAPLALLRKLEVINGGLYVTINRKKYHVTVDKSLLSDHWNKVEFTAFRVHLN